MMSDDLEEQFAEIGDTAISSAEAVKCEFSEYVEGLKQIRGQLNERISLAENELKQMESNATDDLLEEP